MKTLIILTLSVAALAADKTEICYRRTLDDGTVKESCMTIPQASVSAMKQFITAQTIQTGTDAQGKPITEPKYKGPAHLVFAHLGASLFGPLQDMYPSKAVSDAKVQLDAATTAAATAKQAALPAVPVTVEP